MSVDFGFVLAIAFSEVVPAAIYFYAAYWAFSIRRALVGRNYRNQALWLGSLGFLLAFVGFFTYSTNITVDVLFGLFYAALFLATFAFIDSVIPVARRSDPLLRPILHWEKSRILLWVDAAFLAALAFFGSFPNGPSNAVGNVIFAIVGGSLFAVSGAALIIGARRSGDPLLRASLKWLGVALLILVISIVEGTVLTSAFNISNFDTYYSYPALPGGALTIAGAYALYRSARSLAPIGRLSAIEPAAKFPAVSVET